MTLEGRATTRSRAEDVLRAARRVFLTSGYEGASVDAIAALANVSKATLYARFGSKEKLFAAMVEEFCAAEERAVADIGSAHQDTGSGLAKVALILLSGWAEPDALRFGRMVMGETARFPQLGRIFAEAGIVRRQHIVAGVLRRLHAQGDLAVADADLAAELFVAAARGMVQARSLLKAGKPPSRQDLRAMALAITELTLAAYRPAPTAPRAALQPAGDGELT